MKTRVAFWRVVRPPEGEYLHYRLDPDAENKVGEVGIEVTSHVDFYGQTQRELQFDDGSKFWFYPIWLQAEGA